VGNTEPLQLKTSEIELAVISLQTDLVLIILTDNEAQVSLASQGVVLLLQNKDR